MVKTKKVKTLAGRLAEKLGLKIDGSITDAETMYPYNTDEVGIDFLLKLSQQYGFSVMDLKHRVLVFALDDGRLIWLRSKRSIPTDLNLNATIFVPNTTTVDIPNTTLNTILGLFDVDDDPIVLDHLEGTQDQNSLAIGPDAFNAIALVAGEFVKGAPSPKL